MEIAPFLVGLWLVPLGAYLIYINRRVNTKIAEARLWPQAKGRMVKIEKTGMSTKIADSDDYKQYQFTMQYEYDVDGRKYDGDDIVLGRDFVMNEDAVVSCECFPDFWASYNPQQHGECIVFLGHNAEKDDAIKYVGYVLIVVGIGLLVLNTGWFL